MTGTASLEEFIDEDDIISDDESSDHHLEVDPLAWKVLIVDDDEQIHRVTKFALTGFRYDGHPLNLSHAYSGKEARKMLKDDEYGVIFLDVVMESDHAGLEVVNYIRKELKNYRSRIILRTGQPGMAPEKSVAQEYDIDDYRQKADLSSLKLHTSLVTSLRNYKERVKIDEIVETKTKEVIEKNTEILQSIHYAERLQNAIMPSVEYIHRYVPEFSLFFRPKDIVSGDFYFFSYFRDRIIIANVDCTGHGVPGAIMSIFAYSLLSLNVHDYGISDCGAVLYNLDKKLKELLHQEEGKIKIMDGMDMSLVLIYPEKNELHFAGANHNLYLYKEKTVHVIEGNRLPIGASYHENKMFTSHRIQFAPEDMVYLFSDGIVDQFGGEDQRKFGIKRVIQLIESLAEHPINRQASEVEKAFDQWKGNNNQLDDVSFMVFKPSGIVPLGS